MSLIIMNMFLVSYLHLSSARCYSPVHLPGKVHQVFLSDSSQSICPSEAEKQIILDQLSNELDDIIENQIQQLLVPLECPGRGWVKVVDFNLEANSSAECLGNWLKAEKGNISYCYRHERNTNSCTSATISVGCIQDYTQVCGRVRAYQIGDTNGFFPSYKTSIGIDDAYLNGVSITYGMPRRHVWSFVSGYSSTSDNYHYGWLCPCIADRQVTPNYVNESHFCDVGASMRPEREKLYTNSLWDEMDCLMTGDGCCSGRYFVAELTAPTSDNLEVRICGKENAGVGVDQIELYVK